MPLAVVEADGALVDDPYDIRPPRIGRFAEHVFAESDDVGDFGDHALRLHPRAAHVVVPVPHAERDGHAVVLAVDGRPLREVLGVAEPLGGDDALRPGVVGREVAVVEFVPHHLAAVVEGGARQVAGGGEGGRALRVGCLRDDHVDGVRAR